jgi:DNA-binding transcriptional regulator YdaS (Cro superfamily)
MNSVTRLEALNAAVNAAGSQSQFARDMGVFQPTVWRWLNQSKQLPAEYVLTAERLYGVSRHDLRPDIYPRPISIGAEPVRDIMIDQGGAGRFIGVDRHAGIAPQSKAAA